MGKKLLLVICWLILLTPIVTASLNCTIQNSTCDGIIVYHMSNLTNAHAEQENESNYDYNVCCKETEGLTVFFGICGESIINLSSSTDAHVEQSNETDYPFSVCLKSLTGTLTCNYQTSACEEACLGTISTNITGSHTNLHIADCVTDPYETYICCNYSTSSEGGYYTSGGGRGGLTRTDRTTSTFTININTTRVWELGLEYPIQIETRLATGHYFDPDKIAVLLINNSGGMVSFTDNITRLSIGNYLALMDAPESLPLDFYNVTVTVTRNQDFNVASFQIATQLKHRTFFEFVRDFIIDLRLLLFGEAKDPNLVLETKDTILNRWNALVIKFFRQENEYIR